MTRCPRRGHPCLFVAALLASSGCGSGPPPTSAPPPAEVTVSRPLVQEVTDSLDYTGTTAALATVEVRARVTGFLQKVHFEPRAKVRQGDVLFTIDPRPFDLALASDKATLEAKKNELTKAQFDAEKVADLFKREVAAKDEYVEKTSRRDALIAEVARAEAQVRTAQLNLDWCSVTAPTNGRISRNLVDPGNIVTADVTLLANIVYDDSIYAYFNASERDVLILRERARTEAAAASGIPASQPEMRDQHWPVQMALMTEQGYPHQGMLDYTAPQVDAGTGTIQVRGIFPNPTGSLLAGLFVRLRVPIGKPKPALLVTERALGSDQGQRFVLVVNDKNVVEYRPLKIGSLQEGLRVIDAGLTPSDWVIVNGIQRVRPGVTVKPVQAPMPTPPQATTAAATPHTSSGTTMSGDSVKK